MSRRQSRSAVPVAEMIDSEGTDNGDEEQSSGTEYEVECLLEKRKQVDETEYLVKWKGFPEEESTWELRSNIASDVIDAFEKLELEKQIKAGQDKDQSIVQSTPVHKTKTRLKAEGNTPLRSSPRNTLKNEMLTSSSIASTSRKERDRPPTPPNDPPEGRSPVKRLRRTANQEPVKPPTPEQKTRGKKATKKKTNLDESVELIEIPDSPSPVKPRRGRRPVIIETTDEEMEVQEQEVEPLKKTRGKGRGHATTEKKAKRGEKITVEETDDKHEEKEKEKAQSGSTRSRLRRGGAAAAPDEDNDYFTPAPYTHTSKRRGVKVTMNEKDPEEEVEEEAPENKKTTGKGSKRAKAVKKNKEEKNEDEVIAVDSDADDEEEMEEEEEVEATISHIDTLQKSVRAKKEKEATDNKTVKGKKKETAKKKKPAKEKTPDDVVDITEDDEKASADVQEEDTDEGDAETGEEQDEASCAATRELAHIERLVCTAMRGVFDSSSENTDLPNSLRQMKSAYLKYLKCEHVSQFEARSFFFENLMVRINYMLESTDRLEARQRVLRLIARWAVATIYDMEQEDGIPETAEDPALFVCECISLLSNAKEAAVRQQLCSLIGYLFHASAYYGKLSMERRVKTWGQESDEEKPHMLSQELREKIYAVLRERQHDKMVPVRCEVIRAVAAIQDDPLDREWADAIERSPKEIVLMGCRDLAWECRLAALQVLLPQTDEHLDNLVEMALGDKSVKVRRAAMRRIGVTEMKSFTSGQLVELLHGTISDAEALIREGAHSLLLAPWMKQLSQMSIDQRKKGGKAKRREASEELTDEALVAAMLEKEDKKDSGVIADALTDLAMALDVHVFTDTEKCTTILEHALDVHREENGLTADHAPMTDMVKALLCDRDGPPRLLHAGNYKQILNRQLSATQQARMSWMWRTVLDYCWDKAGDKVDRKESIHRLAPTLKDAVGMTKRLQELDPLADADDTQAVSANSRLRRFTIVQLLGAMERMDIVEPVGRRDWIALLKSLVETRDGEVHKKICDQVMRQLAQHVWGTDADAALSYLCDITSIRVHRALNPNATLMEQTISLGNEPTGESPVEEDEAVRRQCLMLINSVFKTGLIKKLNPMVLGLYEQVVEKCCTSLDPQQRIWAYECVSIMGMHEEKVAASKVPMLIRGLAIPEMEPDEKSTIMYMLTDQIVSHGYDKVQIWATSGVTHKELTEDPRWAAVATNGKLEIMDMLIPFADIDRDTQLARAAFESVCKILLNSERDRPQWKDAVSNIILNMFRLKSGADLQLKAMLGAFIPIFASLNRFNQHLLVGSFMQLIDWVRHADNVMDEDLAMMEVDRACSYIVFITSEGVLSENAAGRNMDAAHVVLLKKILTHLLENPEDSYWTQLYAKSASLLEMDGLSKERADEMLAMCEEVTDNLVGEGIPVRSKLVQSLKQLTKRIEQHMERLQEKADTDGDDAVSTVESVISSIPSTITTATTTATTTKKSKKKKKAQPSKPGKSARVLADEVLNQEDKDEEDECLVLKEEVEAPKKRRGARRQKAKPTKPQDDSDEEEMEE